MCYYHAPSSRNINSTNTITPEGVSKLIKFLNDANVGRLGLSGGEPFLQAEGLSYIAKKSKEIGKVVLNIRLASMLTKCEIELNVIEDGSTARVEDSAVKTDNTPSTDVSGLEALFK